MSHFTEVARVPGDPVLGLLDAYHNDPCADKLSLGVGVYKDTQGLTPIPRSVKFAEQRLVEQETAKSCVDGHGDTPFAARLAELTLGAASPLLLEQRADTTQTPGGTGALYLVGDFITHCLPSHGIWLSDPTWPIHETLSTAVGLKVSRRPYVSANSRLDVEAMLAGLERIPQGGVVLLYACCHNPIGFDLSHDDWHRVFDVVRRHEPLPLIDFTYQDFDDSLEEDAWVIRLFAGELPEVLVISSCSKNFGLYCDRAGALTVCAQNAEKLTDVRGQLAFLARNLQSTPPAHGAEMVAAILGGNELKGLWQGGVEGTRSRIASPRIGLVEALAPYDLAERFAHVGTQRGAFSYAGLNPQQVARLRDRHAVYLVSDGRANVAGLDARRPDHLTQTIVQVCADWILTVTLNRL